MATPTFLTVAVIGSLVLLNVLGLRAFKRFDLTSERAYTLSGATKDTLAGLDDAVTITAYFTQDLPAPYASNSRYVRDLLEEFRAASKGKLSFEFIDPAAQDTEKDKEQKRDLKRDIFGRTFREPTQLEKELAQTGIQSVQIRVVEADQQQTKNAYMGVVIRYHEKKEVIPVVPNPASLEYDLTSLIRKLTRTKTPVIALLQGHDEPKPEKLRQLSALLSQTYEVRPVELQGKEAFDPDVDALLVLGPEKPLQPNELKAIDQLVMHGKPVAMFLDSVHFDMRTAEQKPADTNLQQLLTAYGVTVDSANMVADVNSANLNISEQRGFMMVQMPVPYPFIPIVKRLEGESPISKGIGDVTFPFASKVTVTPGDGKQVLVLARSSPKSWVEAKPQNLDPRRDWRSEQVNFTGPYDLMVQVSGKLKSPYAGQAAVSGPNAPLSESQGESRLIVAGTSALFQDDFFGRPNAALLMNVTDWLLLDPALLAMRTRGVQLAQLKGELSDGTRNATKFGNAFGLPLALALFGLIRWRLRESRRLHVAL
ncbi:MAG: GldG family protein [Archangiaceae bacterium]|nr:GldG family protein [Archangiaceae bacterium]